MMNVMNVSDRPILLVEDNADDVELTTLALSEAKITNPLVVAKNGVEALDYLFGTGSHAGRDSTDQPVVVLLDIKLPLLSGIDVLRRMREDERTRRTPVVMLTSSREQVDIAATYDLGANSYVQKPVDFENFVVAARQLGLYWTVLNQPAEAGPTGPVGDR
jgi:two-component system, response regulator